MEAKGRRVEVVAIGAELDAVLRADRMLQLWAEAETGEGGNGVDGEAGRLARLIRQSTIET